MKILMISTDMSILITGSEARPRMLEYGTLVDELHIIIFARGKRKTERIGNVFLHPTNSRGRWLYIFDAVRIGKAILATRYSLLPTRWLVTTQDPFETGLAG